MNKEKKKIGIYFHIPYCRAKCHFCAFYVVPGIQKRVNEYFKALKQEAINYLKDPSFNLLDYEITSIYAGGGTPSSVDYNFITDYLQFLKDNFNVSKDAEITTEASPETLTYEKARAYYKVGFNRISIGLQAWQDKILKQIGRIHTSDKLVEAYNFAKDSGFKNINIDLIFGIPNQTLDDWKESLGSVIKLSPTHIACYSLIIDEDSTFGKLKRLGKLNPVSEALDRKMYKTAKKTLKLNGFYQYEIANFALKGYEAKHNLSMWRDNDYIGFGASAYSRVHKKHFNNAWSIEKYIVDVTIKGLPQENLEEVSSKDEIVEHILLKLRLNEGINLIEFKEKFKIDIKDIYYNEIEKLKTSKLIRELKDRIVLTSRGQDLENVVGIEFV